MAEAFVEIALEKLFSLAGREVGLFLGFNEEKEKLESMFTAIKSTLQDAEDKQFSDTAIKDWLRKLKDVAYNLDDILDECAYEAYRLEYQGVMRGLSDSVQCSCLSFFDPKHVYFRYKIAKKMERISGRLKQIFDERTQFHLTPTVQERTKTSGVPEWRQTISSTIEPQIYGRKEETKRILNSLIGDASHSENLSVYPIVGMGGLGKTTLAQLIFNHERVVNHFELKMWVCVSEDFSLTTTMKAIIKEASGKACQDSGLEPLRKTLQDLLRAKRYLLVLDDVWDEKPDNWQTLKSVLDCGAKGSSILVTTRHSNVAAIMRTMPLHELSILSDNDGWELFKHQAFEPNEVEPVELVQIGKEIVKKCGGVPLAAKALGGLLRFKRNKNEWLNVLQSNFLELSQSGRYSIMQVLRLSYLNLPVKLRQCFAYCAIFPKDEEIEKQRLIELWVTNEFISSKGTLDAEDVGDDVWNELHRRSFFQDITTDDFGEVTHFKMHDLVHDLAQSVAEDVCCLTSDKGVTALSKRIHHLSNRMRSPRSNKLHHVKSLRTSIFPGYSGVQFSPHGLKCYSLRVLHWERIENLSSSIGDLKHLRYLNLSKSDFETLPESIGKLWNLQILKLDNCERLRKLPNSLIRLKALQQLSLTLCCQLSSLPAQIGQMTSLRILSMYIVGEKRGFLLGELGALNLKGYLEIRHLERVKSVEDAKEANMLSKQLKELSLSWSGNDLQENAKISRGGGDLACDGCQRFEFTYQEILEVLQPDTQQLWALHVKGYKGANFPQWVFNPSLVHLSIVRCGEVKGVDEALKHMTALKMLTLRELPKLESLPDCFGNLPLLRELSIHGCPKLRFLPTSLRLSNLQDLSIWRCSPELKKRCQKKTGEDRPIIAHIPHIRVSSAAD